MAKQNVSVKLEEDVVDALETEAEQQGKSRSAYIRSIVQQRHATADVTRQLHQQRENIEGEYEAIIDDKNKEIQRLEGKIDRVRIEVESAVRSQLEQEFEQQLEREKELRKEAEKKARERRVELMDALDTINDANPPVQRLEDTMEKNFSNIDRALKKLRTQQNKTYRMAKSSRTLPSKIFHYFF